MISLLKIKLIGLLFRYIILPLKLMNTFYSPPTTKSPHVKFSYASPTHQKTIFFSPYATDVNTFKNISGVRPVASVIYSPRLGDRQAQNKKSSLISSQRWKREQKQNQMVSQGKKSASQSMIINNKSSKDNQQYCQKSVCLSDLSSKFQNQQLSTVKSLISLKNHDSQYNNQNIQYSSVFNNKLKQQNNEKRVFHFSKVKPRHRKVQPKLSNTKIQDFVIGQMIGKGGIGRVFLAKHKKTSFYYALKMIRKAEVKDVEQLAFSIKCHFFFNHPNLAQLYACFSDEKCIYLVMEICIDGSLSKYRKKIKNDEERQYIFSGVSKGIHYMHNLFLRHGDLKLENILINHGFPKITDFDCIFDGKHKQFKQSRRKSKLWGSPAYFSPDMIKQSTFTLSDDIWSLGILMYEIYCNNHPFNLKGTEDLANIIDQGMTPFPFSLKESTKMLISKILTKNRDQRATIEQILKYFN